MSPDPNPVILCAENIAISSLLHSIPAPPSGNSISYQSAYNTRNTLSFETERKLASTLAFLAHSKDDPDHIPALCLVENIDSGTLNVIIAVNKANYCDGENAIRRINQGFESIFAILASVSLGECHGVCSSQALNLSGSNHQTSIETQVLANIVSMCSPRILCRLRLASSGKKSIKRSFKDTLQEAVLAVKKISRQKLNDRNLLDTAEQFTITVREVRKLIDSWSRYQVNARLIEIVEGIRQLQQIEQISSLICMIPNHDMDPSLRESLLNIISKVSRYWEAARFLYRTAKKFPLARKMRTVPVRLPPNESTLLTLPLSSTTVRDSVSSEVAKVAEFEKGKDSSAVTLPESNQASSNVDNSDPRTVKATDSEIEHMPLDNPTPSHHAEATEELTYCGLVQRPKAHGCLKPGESTGFYRVGSPHSLQIHIEHASGSKNLEYHLKWLGIEEIAQLRENGSLTPVIDAEHLEGTVTFHEQDSFYLTAKDTVLRIGWASVDDRHLPSEVAPPK